MTRWTPALYLPECIYPVLLSEGCYWGKCDFCDYPFLASQDPFVVSSMFRDPAHVVEDIRQVHERFGVRAIDLISDAVPMGYFARLAKEGGQELRDRGIRTTSSISASVCARAES
jgi:radical SAM superfamily enzyme YgiQ (UPF0313 family)